MAPSQALSLLTVAVSVAFLASFLYVTSARIGYPFALEWMEGTSLVQVDRLLAGQPLYVEPSLDYIPLIYPPLYYYVGALFVKWMGAGFLPLRVVSLFSTLGCMVCIYSIIGRIRPHRVAQWTAVGLFAATFRLGEAWFDIARVDMLALFLSLSSIYLLQSANPLGTTSAGIAATLACLTKQSYLPLLVACMVYAVVLDSRRGALFASSAIASYAASFLLLDAGYPGWYRFFVYLLPYGHGAGLNLPGAMRLLAERVIFPMLGGFLMAVAYFILSARRGGHAADRALALPVGAAMAIGWLGLMNSGGFNNVLGPWHAMLAVAAGLLISKVLTTQSASALTKSVALGCALVQLGGLRYSPQDQIPSQQDLLAGNDLVRRIGQVSGEVYVPYHPELLLFAGRPALADWVGLKELKGGFGGDVGWKEWQRVKIELMTAFRRHRFAAILVDGRVFPGEPMNHYEGDAITYVDDQSFLPVTGWQIRPAIIYVPPEP